MPNERTIAFVVARLSSSRLAAKQLRLIGNRPLLGWIIDQLRQCREIDEIVIATVAEAENEPLREFSRQEQLACFWYQGEVDHVTNRLRRAAENYGADICVLISGDCPLIYAPAIDDLLGQFKASVDAGFLEVPSLEDDRIPALEGVGIARRWAWQLADDLSDRPELKEHQFPIIWQRRENFNILAGRLPEHLYLEKHRFSVDTLADLEFMNRIHDLLQAQEQLFELPQALKLLEKQPELFMINRHVHQRKLVESPQEVLLAIDCGEGFGYGHLSRSLELGLQLIERLGWHVTYLVDDVYAVALLQQQGQRLLWGALGRTARPIPGDLHRFERQLSERTFTLVLLDLYPRKLSVGWKTPFAEALLVTIDSLEPWSEQTDLILIPGVTGPAGTDTVAGVPVLQGLEYTILRRAIRRAEKMSRHKDIDLLVYLRQQQQLEAVRQEADRRGWKIRFVDGFVAEFPELLARTRFFLGNFGYSFYEALYLGATPIAWPVSSRHMEEAQIFYQRLQLPELVVKDDDPSALFDRALGALQALPRLYDGTVNITRQLEAAMARRLDKVLEG